MKNDLEQKLSDLYISNLDIIGEGFPAPVNSRRAGYLEAFNLLSLPGKKDERYRHTDLRVLFGEEREYFFTPSPAPQRPEPLFASGGEVVDVLNGFCVREGLRETAGGVVAGSLRAAANDMPEVFGRYYNSVADNEKEALAALNSAFMQDGAFVYVPDGVNAGGTITLNFDYASGEQAQMCFPRALIVVGKGAKADIVITHRVAGGTRFLIDFVREVVAQEGAEVNVGEIVVQNGESAFIGGNYLRQQAGSRTGAMNIWLGEGTTRANVCTDLAGPGCEGRLHGLYLASGRDNTDINVCVNHLVPDCESFEMVKGVASGEAVGAFTGKVYVAPDAQRTVALQQSRNLQLSDSCRIYTEPQLEIYADDVKCSHGATVGQLDDAAIFYMRQRGVSEKDARRLQLLGFVNDVVSHCRDVEICPQITALAEKRVAELQ